MADRRVTSRLNMANALKEVCDNNPAAVALIPAFVALLAALNDRITALRALVKKLSKNNSGFAEDKTNWRERLSLLLSVVCGTGVSYAKKIGDVVLENNFDFPVSTFTEMRDTELIEMAQSIIELQATVAAQLRDYGIDTVFMADVTTALANFEEASPKPIANVYTSEADRALLLKMAFSLSEFVLQDMMKAALIYKVLDPVFYDSLNNASLIRNQGLRHEQDPEAAAAKEEILTERKEVQELPSAAALLHTNVQEMNVTNEHIETPAMLEPSWNGH